MALDAEQLLLESIEHLRSELRDTRGDLKDMQNEISALRETVASVRAQATLFSGFISAMIAGFVTWIMSAKR